MKDHELTFSLGVLIGTIIDNFTVKLGGRQSYIVPLGIVYVVPGLLSLALFFIPESPRWLLQMDNQEAARKSLLWLRPFPETVEAELFEMKTAIDAEKSLAQNSEIVDLFRNPVDRRRTLLAVGAVSLQAASGAMYMICEFPEVPMLYMSLTGRSIRNLFLRDGWCWECLRELLHLDCCWRLHHFGQFCYHHQIRTSQSVPDDWIDHLWHLSTHHRCSIHSQS